MAQLATDNFCRHRLEYPFEGLTAISVIDEREECRKEDRKDFRDRKRWVRGLSRSLARDVAPLSVTECGAGSSPDSARLPPMNEIHLSRSPGSGLMSENKACTDRVCL